MTKGTLEKAAMRLQIIDAVSKATGAVHACMWFFVFQKVFGMGPFLATTTVVVWTLLLFFAFDKKNEKLVERYGKDDE